MAHLFTVTVFGENILFFAERGLTPEEYRRKAIAHYKAHHVVSPGTVVKNILKSYLNGDVNIQTAMKDASEFLNPEDLYDFRHMICLMDSLTGLED